MTIVVILQLVLELFRFINNVTHEDRKTMVTALQNTRQNNAATGNTDHWDRIKQAIVGG